MNGKPLTKYKVRGSIEDIKAVNVSGKVFILETLLMKRLVPSRSFSNPFSLSLSLFLAYIIQIKFLNILHQAKPAMELLPGGIQSGSWVTLQAIPKKNWRQ